MVPAAAAAAAGSRAGGSGRIQGVMDERDPLFTVEVFQLIVAILVGTFAVYGLIEVIDRRPTRDVVERQAG